MSEEISFTWSRCSYNEWQLHVIDPKDNTAYFATMDRINEMVWCSVTAVLPDGTVKGPVTANYGDLWNAKQWVKRHIKRGLYR